MPRSSATGPRAARLTVEDLCRGGSITRLIELGGILVIQVPQRIRRELGLLKRDLVVVRKTPDGSIIATPLLDFIAFRRGGQYPRALPD